MEGVNDDIERFSPLARLDRNKPVRGVVLCQGGRAASQPRRYTDGKIRQAPDIADETTGNIHFDNTSGFEASTVTRTKATRMWPSRIWFWCRFRPNIRSRHSTWIILLGLLT